MASPKDHKRLLKALKVAGCEIVRGSGKHGKIIYPDGTKQAFALTPSDHRAFKNLLSDIRRRLGDPEFYR